MINFFKLNLVLQIYHHRVFLCVIFRALNVLPQVTSFQPSGLGLRKISAGMSFLISLLICYHGTKLLLYATLWYRTLLYVHGCNLIWKWLFVQCLVPPDIILHKIRGFNFCSQFYLYHLSMTFAAKMNN